VLADLTVAVEVGMVLAALLFIRRVARTTTVSRVTPDYIRAGWPHILQGKDIPANVAVFRIHGPFLFGATDKLLAITEDLESLPPVVILRLRNTTAIDATGLSAIADLADALRASQRTLIVCGAPAQPTALMHRGVRGAPRPRQHLRERGPGAGPGKGRAESPADVRLTRRRPRAWRLPAIRPSVRGGRA